MAKILSFRLKFNQFNIKKKSGNKIDKKIDPSKFDNLF
jgi:hypothetical protein